MIPTSGKRSALGLDIGGTLIKAIHWHEGAVQAEFELPSGADRGPAAVRAAIAEVVGHFQARNLLFQVIGVGCAGSVDGARGIVRNSPNFAGWKNVPLKEWIETDHQTRATVDNDANCAVFGEWKAGRAKGRRNVVLLTLGTGVGGGLILDGRLYRGSTGTGGELGHFSIHADGLWCPCGNRGCFERYCSGSALRVRGGNLDPKEIFARADEPAIAPIIEDFIADFQIGLTSLANVFDPDCILLGGAVSRGVIAYLDRIQAWVKAHAFPSVGEKVELLLTQHDNWSGAIGAALLALLDEHTAA